MRTVQHQRCRALVCHDEAQWALPLFAGATCKQARSPLAGSRDCPGPVGSVASCHTLLEQQG